MSSTMISSLPVLLGLTLVITAIGFRRLVYFLSIGYAFAIAAMALASAVIFWGHAPLLAVLQSATLLFWGLRLGAFVTQRELSPNYQEERARIDQQYGRINLPAKFFIWISVSGLYLMMVSPNLFGLGSATPPARPGSSVQGLGLLIMIAGLGLEGLADRQKAAFKAKSPTNFCQGGVYQWVRCPNYLGEITFWVGNWVMGLAFYRTALEWVISLIGVGCIILIMLGSTRRLESTQLKRYGHLPDYQHYARTVPILFPYVPVYTLQTVHILFG